MIFQISHTTCYHYDAPFMGECFMEAHLRPISVSGEQVCHDFVLSTEPDAPLYGYDLPGQMGMVNHFIVRGGPISTLVIHAFSTVETLRANPFDGVTFESGDWSLLLQESFQDTFAEWLAPTDLVPLDGVWPAPPAGNSVFEYGQELARQIYSSFEYMPETTDINTPLSQFVAQRRGVCQDFAHLMLSVARAAGVPARYVSGYIYTGDDMQMHGAGASHAWVELFLPHAGIWKGFDPTNNLIVSDKHVKIAVGRDYADVPPTKGLLRAARGEDLPASQRLEVRVQITQRAVLNGYAAKPPPDGPLPDGPLPGAGSSSVTTSTSVA